MAMRFAIYDLTGTIADADLIAYAAAQQAQLREDVSPAHDGLCDDAAVRAVTLPADAMLGQGEIGVYWHPTAPTDNEGAIAFHDRTGDGTPIIHGYADLAASSGDTFSEVLSHELIETVIDPDLNACCELADGTIIDHEACDRVQAESYVKAGVSLSNFNTRAAFSLPTDPPAGTRYDFLGNSKTANETRPGGYSQTFIAGKGWTMTTNDSAPQSKYRAALAALGLSRVARRAKQDANQAGVAMKLSR